MSERGLIPIRKDTNTAENTGGYLCIDKTMVIFDGSEDTMFPLPTSSSVHL
jgi:hypothetical protein